MVAVFLFVFVIVITGSSYLLAQKAYNKGSTENELAQNIRVSTDRITREIRQSVAIVTNLPPTAIDPLNPPAPSLTIQDGHDVNRITYITYYLNGSELKRKQETYYFSSDPNIYVLYNSTDGFGNPPEVAVLSDEIIAEYLSGAEFYGASGLVNISLTLSKNQKTLKIDTSAYSRN